MGSNPTPRTITNQFSKGHNLDNPIWAWPNTIIYSLRLSQTMRDVKVAMVNFLPILGDVEGNLSRMEEFTALAKQEGASLICFPELSATGYSIPQSMQYAESSDGRIASFIVGMSERHEICVSAGFVELLEGKKFISQILAESGRKVGIYRKTHLGHHEREFFHSGNELPVFETSLGKVGISICWESRFPEVLGVLALNGAEMILMPYASGPGGIQRRDIWHRYLPTRARDNSVYIVACNSLRDEDGGAGGGVMALGCKGDVLSEDYSFDEKFLLADLSAEESSKARTRGTMGDNFFLAERRPELYSDLASDRFFN